MPPEIQKVETAGDIKQFILFAHEIYKNDPHWVAPLNYERVRFFNPKINPFFEHAAVEMFIARNTSGRPVGRIAMVQDSAHNDFHNEKTGFFGLFECVDDLTVARSLLDTALNWCHQNKLNLLRGPVSLSTNHECGLLVDNFNDPPVMGIPYNPPYYSELLEKCGLTKTKDLISFSIDVVGIPKYLQRIIPRIVSRGRFKVRPLDMKQFNRELDILWGIYNTAWERNWGFVPMNRKEFFFAASEMKAVVDPELCFLAEVNGEPAGFSLTLPDVNQALKPLKGKLFPFGWLRFLRAKKSINRYRVITLGVKKQYQRLGIDAYFYFKTYEECLRKNIPLVDMSWVLEDNQDIIVPIQRVGGVPYKRHRIYERICEY